MCFNINYLTFEISTYPLRKASCRTSQMVKNNFTLGFKADSWYYLVDFYVLSFELSLFHSSID